MDGSIRKHKEWFRQALGAGLGTALVILSSCSPSSFFGNKTDKQVEEATPYRKVNTSCSELHLGGAQLDIPAFKGLLHCFNSEGALEPVETLVNGLTDEELGAIVDTVNRYALSDPRLMYDLESTYYTLDRRKQLDESLTQLGKLLQNQQFIAASIALLKDGYFATNPDGTRAASDLLKVISHFSTKLNDANVRSALDTTLSMADSKAFTSLQPRFRAESQGSRSAEVLARNLTDYLKEERDAAHQTIGRDLLESIATRELYPTLDQLLGSTEAELKTNIPRSAALLDTLLASDGKLMESLNSLFHYLNRPISCMNGGASVPNGVLHVMREISLLPPGQASQFIERDNLITLTAMGPFCSYPLELALYYPSLIQLAETDAVEPAADLLRSFYSVERKQANGQTDHPMARLLADVLSDTGTGRNENRGGIKRMIPFLSELNERKVFEDFLLLSTILPENERESLSDAAKALLEPIPELQNRSAYDFMTGVLSKLDPVKMGKLLLSMKPFIDSDEKILVPALTRLRESYHANDVHPLIRVATRLAQDAPKNEKLFNVLFSISEKPEFGRSIRLISTMAGDGRLKELVGATVTLFHNYAAEGSHPITEGKAPAFTARRNHNLGADDLNPRAEALKLGKKRPDFSACAKLDTRVSILDYQDSRFEEQFGNWVQCVGSDGRHPEESWALDFLHSSRMPDGRSLLAMGVGRAKSLPLDAEENAYLVSQFIGDYDSGRLSKLVGKLPQAQSLVKPLLEVIRPVVTTTAQNLRALELAAARALRNDAVPDLLQFLQGLARTEPAPAPATPAPEFDRERIARWLRAKECVTNATEIARRTDKVIQDSLSSVNTWELVNGEPRKQWDTSSFRRNLDAALELLASPSQSAPGKPLLDTTANFLQYFSLTPGEAPRGTRHFTPEYLARWFHDRAIDYRPITYFYPGESTPRVRLVNSLDRLELVMLGADYIAPIPYLKNFSLEFLADIGDAWGDDPEANWPPEIREQFRNTGKRPKTLKQVVEGIEAMQSKSESLIGFPSLPNCTQDVGEPDGDSDANGSFLRRLPGVGDKEPFIYNSRQVLSVLRENLPGSGTAQDGGLKVLRNFFFEVYHSTPEGYRNPRAGSRNNLSFSILMGRFGLLHQIGRLMSGVNPEDPAVRDLFHAIVATSQSPETRKLARQLVIEDRSHQLLWSILKPILDTSSPNELATMKSLAFYTLANAQALGLIEATLPQLSGILEHYGQYLSGRAGNWSDAVKDALTSAPLVQFNRALYESGQAGGKSQLKAVAADLLQDPSLGSHLVAIAKSIDEDPGAHQALLTLIRRLQEWKDRNPEASANPADPRMQSIARKFRIAAAETLESRDIDQLLAWMNSHPADVEHLFTTLNRSVENGRLQDFLALVRRSLGR